MADPSAKIHNKPTRSHFLAEERIVLEIVNFLKVSITDLVVDYEISGLYLISRHREKYELLLTQEWVSNISTNQHVICILGGGGVFFLCSKW